ncbi:formate dehydrogenase accessory sulfurtransferase FdhD [Nakamurella antarctica]|uniref:Sulfur carrier protein FdhD n=1 Tax=Nakamurella antarctica TaxID=1902245 RepID=A0A3G8ZX87_9ACTN|nr:formate dehydrogenase accessory sulfurtransferase FdhD [Nakamurella antarctica]AZI58281.1 formate dehydrogenase accessory sulfurtransferase FdhD [Nakamurella antarctica]
MRRGTTRTKIARFAAGDFTYREDQVAGEEPLEIRVGGKQLSVTMRTPGHDVELVHGFLHAEGVIGGREDILVARYCDGVDDQGRNTYNVIDIALAAGLADPVPDRSRAVVTSSACGVCGSASIDSIAQRSRYSPGGPARLTPDVIMALPEALRVHQKTFARTGGIHAAALATQAGSLSLIREDVGRHNAVDKVIGAALLSDQLPLSEHALVVSSRASFELVQKAVLAGIGTLIAVSAPSSLAVELATETEMTLIGFTRQTGFNVYTGHHRVVGAEA